MELKAEVVSMFGPSEEGPAHGAGCAVKGGGGCSLGMQQPWEGIGAVVSHPGAEGWRPALGCELCRC